MTLTYRDRGTSGTQLDVMSGGVAVCSLRKNVLSGLVRDVRWEWTWRLENGPPGWRKHDSAQTIEVAQSIIEQQWLAWLEAAGLTEK